MTHSDDPRLNEAKSKAVDDVIAMLNLHGLRLSPDRKELSGPCPECLDSGHNPRSGPPDRFNVNRATGLFFCRKCNIAGGDVISLVRTVKGLSFKDALTFLCGALPDVETEEQKAARLVRQENARRDVEKREAENTKTAARLRAKAIRDALTIWRQSRPGSEGVVRAYLMARGIRPRMLPDLPPALRMIRDRPYVKETGRDDRNRPIYTTVHRGPCMVAGILDQRGDLTAVHQTWVDIDPPHGKARIVWEGEEQPSKLVRGSKKGGAIRLLTPRDTETLVMGEGIETTLSALAAGAVPGAAYWAGVDLGNMAGKMMRGKGLKYAGLPDMDDRAAFVPPAWVRRLVYIQDGDSDPKATRAKLESGLRRAMALRPGLVGQIVHAGEGVDLNDVLQGKDNADPDQPGGI